MSEKCFLVLLMCLLCGSFFACTDNSSEGKTMGHSGAVTRRQQKVQLPCIKIYSYGNVSEAKLELLTSELKKCYTRVELVNQHLDLPKEYYHQGRNRFSGTGLLKDLSRLRKNSVVLGVTDEVIYKANEISPTYGIFGVSPVGAHVALISLTQPSGGKHTDDHLVKLMLHELGHSFGLNHCADEHCFMVDAEHGNKFSQTPSFCKDCKQFLNEKGWKL